MSANNPTSVDCNKYSEGPDMAPNLVTCSPDSVTSKGDIARFKLENGMLRYFPTDKILLQWMRANNPVTIDCKPYSQGPEMGPK